MSREQCRADRAKPQEASPAGPGRYAPTLSGVLGDLGALGATDEAVPLYERRGWRKWLGPTSALTPTGIVRTTDEDGFIYVLPGSHPLDLRGELTCDWRDGDVW